MNAPEKFWMVWSPTGMTPPRHRHCTIAEATRAAEEMAERYPSQEFYVMEAIRLSRKVTVHTVDLKEEEMPF